VVLKKYRTYRFPSIIKAIRGWRLVTLEYMLDVFANAVARRQVYDFASHINRKALTAGNPAA